jgi:hypothetical protein
MRYGCLTLHKALKVARVLALVPLRMRSALAAQMEEGRYDDHIWYKNTFAARRGRAQL